MRIASDGLAFDIDNLDEDAGPGDVEIIQFMRPNGRRRRMLAEVGEELAAKSKGLIISVEELGTGEVAIYVRRKDESKESEHLELAENGPGKNSPNEVLKRMIKSYAAPPIPSACGQGPQYDPASPAERKEGHKALKYDKATRTIETFDPNLPADTCDYCHKPGELTYADDGKLYHENCIERLMKPAPPTTEQIEEAIAEYFFSGKWTGPALPAPPAPGEEERREMVEWIDWNKPTPETEGGCGCPECKRFAEVYNKIKALIQAPPAKGVSVTRDEEWFRRLCEAIQYHEGTNDIEGTFQTVAKTMLREAGVEVKP